MVEVQPLVTMQSARSFNAVVPGRSTLPIKGLSKGLKFNASGLKQGEDVSYVSAPAAGKRLDLSYVWNETQQKWIRGSCRDAEPSTFQIYTERMPNGALYHLGIYSLKLGVLALRARHR